MPPLPHPPPPGLQAEADELNYILCTINAPAMVEVCSRATMDMLTQERLPEMATETRQAAGGGAGWGAMQCREGRRVREPHGWHGTGGPASTACHVQRWRAPATWQP